MQHDETQSQDEQLENNIQLEITNNTNNTTGVNVGCISQKRPPREQQVIQ